MYLMFLGPYEEGGDFRDEGIAGPRRFLDKVWELVDQCERQTLMGVELRHEIVVKWHQTKKRVTAGLESLTYNTSIAALMEFLNALRASNCAARAIVKDIIVMLAPSRPTSPRNAGNGWARAESVFDAPWPTWDEALTVEPRVEVPVQVNGKTRGRVTVSRGASEADVVAAALGTTR